MKEKLMYKLKKQVKYETESRIQNADNEKEKSKVKKIGSYVADDLSTILKVKSSSKICLIFILIVVILSYFLHYVFYPLTQLSAVISRAKPDSFIKSLKIMLDSSTFLVVVMLAVCILIACKIIGKIDKNTDNADNRKLEFLGLSAREHGTAHFMSRKEQNQTFNIVKKGNLKPEDGIIMAENQKGEYICMPWESGKGQDTAPNRNMIMTGPPGARKSTGFLLPLVYQVLGMGYSCFVTDPKAEIYRKTVAYAIRCGYNIKVLNMRGDQFLNSSGWDCLGTVKRSKVPDETAHDFATIVMENTETTGQSVKFWYDGELNLCKFLVLYVTHSKSFRPFIGDTDEEIRKLKEKAAMYGSTYEIEDGFLVNGSNELFESYRNIDQVYAHISTLPVENLALIVENLPVTDIGKKSGMVWLTNNQNVQIVASLATRLQIFQSPLVSKLFSTDEIDFREMSKEKTICYIINSDQKNSYQFLMALFLTFALIEFANIADKSENEMLERPAYFIIEEGKSVGKIPDCATKLSTCRSRKINVIFSWQGLPQMQSIYSGNTSSGKNEWEEILACCSTKICLGAGEKTTAEYMSKMLDVGSIRITSKKRTVSIFNPFHLSDRETRDVSEKRRNLMNPGEIEKLSKSKIIVTSDTIDGVLYLYKIYYVNLPASRDMVFRKDDTPIEIKSGNYYPVWRQIEDIQRSNLSGSVDYTKLVPQLEEKDISEIIKGQEEVVIKRLRKDSLFKKIYDVLHSSIDKEEEKYESNNIDNVDAASLDKDIIYDQMHGGPRKFSYNPYEVLGFDSKATDFNKDINISVPDESKPSDEKISKDSIKEDIISAAKNIKLPISPAKASDMTINTSFSSQINKQTNACEIPKEVSLETTESPVNKEGHNLKQTNDNVIEQKQDILLKESVLPFELNNKNEYVPSPNASKYTNELSRLFQYKCEQQNKKADEKDAASSEDLVDMFKGKRKK